MNDALGTMLVFIFVFIVVPWGSILALRLVGAAAAPTIRAGGGEAASFSMVRSSRRRDR